ncbi:TetR family transcriptional regulator [Pseudonocardia sp. WMMC193]|uniref:acyl-CoA-like ligand-binding transcription factor n=1 Tax=Pseudonocardia sp. WMMC193 TaxID=2911965 RepID=UPI001F0301BC|nr:TetR family transcriptional regulator [Pseudonocardia sp. WMMC193]MCF7547855.1 TetR family transcriptional regulator [Pseudonocardia sp. WMMC193]
MATEDEVRVGLRERKKQATRIALSWAAIRLCVERGVDDVRVEDIAAEANVSLRTFRNYFSNKAEAIAARHLDRALQISDELRVRPAGESLWEAITEAVLARFALGQEDEGDQPPGRRWADGVRLMLTEPTLQGEYLKATVAAQAELAAAIAERTGTDVETDVYPHLVAAAVGGAITVASDHWIRANPPVSMATLLRDAFAQLAAGLPAPGTP